MSRYLFKTLPEVKHIWETSYLAGEMGPCYYVEEWGMGVIWDMQGGTHDVGTRAPGD